MCKYFDDSGYECPHENLEDNDYCIFHLQDDNKDVDEFNKGIKEILETEEDSIHLNGFYFPPGTSDFSKMIFQKNINFLNAIFSGIADFRIATFLGNAMFYDVTFLRDAYFLGAIFSGDAIFTDATFSEVYFNSATFSGEAYFNNALFSGQARFLGATFSNAYFTSVLFSGHADFKSAIFSNAYFTSVLFSGQTRFLGATFSGQADFMYATVSEKAGFEYATFLENANFEYATFLENANFIETTFLRNADFRGAEFSAKFVFIPKESNTIILKHAYFSDNVRIKADMGKCSFANSNIERVDMIDSIWIEDNKPKNSYSAFIEWFKNKIGISGTSIKILEEQQGDLSSNWKELEGIYRRLKQSYQKFGDSSIAGKFYYQEMECKRKQLKGVEKHFWYFFYNKLCGYGEKPFNVIWASGLIILVSSLLFFYLGIELLGSEVLDVPPRLIDYNLSLNFQWVIMNYEKVIGDWLECLYTSVITFTTLGYGDVHPIGFSRVVASVEAGFGIIMTALFIFVFSRKMLR